MAQTRENLDMNAPASLIWLPLGDRPTAETFGPDDWFLEDAIDRASAGEPGKAPWIKIGEWILEPRDVAQVFMDLRAARSAEPSR